MNHIPFKAIAAFHEFGEIKALPRMRAPLFERRKEGWFSLNDISWPPLEAEEVEVSQIGFFNSFEDEYPSLFGTLDQSYHIRRNGILVFDKSSLVILVEEEQ